MTESIPITKELNRLKRFLLWARDNDIQLHEVHFGDIALSLSAFAVPGQESGGEEEKEDLDLYGQLLERRSGGRS